MLDLNQYIVEKECQFEGEKYSVRDNGAVLRHSKVGGRHRKTDNSWTFGVTNSANPYLHIAGTRVHRIVATAFHGDPLDPKYVVDHIDSNGRNNRPENLRWLTRLENTLKNPVTRKKIEFLCGSIDTFLANPSMLNDLSLEPNLHWMKSVTLEEAQNCKTRMSIWANSPNTPSKNKSSRTGAFSDRVFKPVQKWEAGIAGEPGLDFAETPMCAQYMMGSAYFPLCPQELGNSSLDTYLQNIKSPEVFSYGNNSPKLTVLESVKTKLHPSIIVLCESSGSRPYAICGITLNEKGYFIHFVIGTYGNLETAKTAFELEQELQKHSSDGYNGFRK